MKLKSLLPAIAFVAAGLTASAVVPIHFRDAVGQAADGGGHMVYPFLEGTEAMNEAVGMPYGEPQFAEDGSIEVRPFDGMNTGLGLYFRTQKLGRTGDVDGPVSEDYVIFAMDYKSNRTASDMVVFLHEPTIVGAQIMGNIIEITDEYKTVYAPLTTRKFADGTTWGVENWENNYMWISWNDGNVKTPEWRITVKNLRLLTKAEAEAECQSAAGDYNDIFSCANADIVRDVDPDMDNEFIYTRVEGAPNPVLATSNIVKPIPAANTKFTFEYKYVGAEPAALAFHSVQGGGYTAHVTAVPKLEPCEDQYASEWKVYEVDLSDLINNYNFGQGFACNDQLHIQTLGLKDGEVLYLRNAKWVNPKGGAVEMIEGLDENAPVEYFNLQGVRVAEPANGLYIKRQGNKATKVLVK